MECHPNPLYYALLHEIFDCCGFQHILTVLVQSYLYHKRLWYWGKFSFFSIYSVVHLFCRFVWKVCVIFLHQHWKLQIELEQIHVHYYCFITMVVTNELIRILFPVHTCPKTVIKNCLNFHLFSIGVCNSSVNSFT